MPRIKKKQGRITQRRPKYSKSALEKLDDQIKRRYKPPSKKKMNSYPDKPTKIVKRRSKLT